MLEDFYKQHEEIKRYVERRNRIGNCGGYQMLGKYYETEENSLNFRVNLRDQKLQKAIDRQLVFDGFTIKPGIVSCRRFENHSA